MPSWTFEQAPTWAPDAVATDRGWVDKKTGEVLVSCKKLTKAVPYESLFEKGGKPKKKGRGGARPGAGRPRKVEEPKQDEPKSEEPKVETPKVEEPKAEPKPKAKKAPAKKKATSKRKPRSKAKVTKPKEEVKKDDE